VAPFFGRDPFDFSSQVADYASVHKSLRRHNLTAPDSAKPG
jgi:hypothetical protein